MVYAEVNDTFLHMPPQQRTSAEEIENDPPASDLGVVVTARVILPMVPVSIDPRGLRQSSDQNLRAKHTSFQTESTISSILLPQRSPVGSRGARCRRPM